MREKQRRKCPKFLNQFQCGYRYCLILEIGRIFCFILYVHNFQISTENEAKRN